MPSIDDARSLVAHSQGRLQHIRDEYNRSLGKQEVDPALTVDVKNLMENLRSALDYCAVALFEAHGTSKKSSPRIYFPYARDDQDEAHYRSKLDKSIPGISSHTAVVDDLVSVQHFAPRGNKWLPTFIELNNENKHKRLTPQTRTETRQRELRAGGASMRIGQNAKVSIGKNARVSIGGVPLAPGQDLSVDRPVVAHGPLSQRVIIWVDFLFDGTSVRVMPLLENATHGVGQVVEKLAKHC